MTHILLTRPLEASQQLADELVTLGLSPIVMPLYGFSRCEPGPEIHSAWSANMARRLAVFSSPRAVQFGLSHIPPDQFENLEFVVIGSATRALLESSGHKVHWQAPGGLTSEDLLQMPELQSNPGVAILFGAPGGRKTLAEGLGEFGWALVPAMVYERVPLKPDVGQLEILDDAGDVLSVWTSTSAIELAREYLPEPVWNKILGSPVLVVSSRIQAHFQQLGATFLLGCRR